MDMILGARQLTWRIESQAHWTAAQAVRDGHQSRNDPDEDALVELGDSVRLYQPERVERRQHGEARIVTGRLTKRLVNGWWKHEWIELPPAPPAHS